MLSDSGKSHGFPDKDTVLVGPDDFKLIYETYVGAFPDLHFTIEDLVAEGDRVAVRWSLEMTHLGDSLGIAPTGRRLVQHGASFLVIRDNRLFEGWNELDMHALFQQLLTPAEKIPPPDRRAKSRPNPPHFASRTADSPGSSFGNYRNHSN